MIFKKNFTFLYGYVTDLKGIDKIWKSLEEKSWSFKTALIYSYFN